VRVVVLLPSVWRGGGGPAPPQVIRGPQKTSLATSGGVKVLSNVKSSPTSQISKLAGEPQT